MSSAEFDPLETQETPPVAPRRAGEPPYMAALNPEQRRAVETLDGPLLVLAGAGTGKTRVLTTRLAHILFTGRARPFEILAVTFTNKAAREMKGRIGELIGGAVEGMPWLGTFHALGAQILRRHAELADLKSSFTILDTDDQIRLLKQVMEAENIDDKRWPPRVLAGIIDKWKNRALTPDKVPAADAGFANGRAPELYQLYQQRLKTLNAADFGDLVLESLRVLQDNPDVLERYHGRFRYILVDEYQDTNVAQYLWLRLLARKSRNVCCVGDDDQSIYGWRGAEVRNILRFEEDFPGATVIRLERNYRSTPHILSAASGLIESNAGRLGKTLWTELNEGEKIRLRAVFDDAEEARQATDDIERLQAEGHALNEMAILVRAGAQMRSFEDRFINIGMPYRVIGGPRFYERAEIRDATAYLRVVANAEDDLSFGRIFNMPPRGLGPKVQAAFSDLARRERIPLLAACRMLIETDELKPQARKSLRSLVEMFDRWTALKGHMPHTELAGLILDESGYMERLQNDRSPQAPGRIDNLQEMIRAMDEFETLESYLDHISLVMDLDQGESDDKVTIMTLHAAKGLEFDTVFLPGWEEGLFPSQRTLDENGTEGLEEERRLAYVGITRARRRAVISHAAMRLLYGRMQPSVPSRFIDELPADHVEVEPGAGAHMGASRFDSMHGFESGYSSPGWQRGRAAFAEGGGRFGAAPMLEGKADLLATNDPGACEFAVGERVFHQKFGYGRVADVEGNKLTVDFDKAGQKRVIASFLEPPP
ncbi:MAG: UvrD-helicase domain-containing protein [Alphaproteobacteria bacterium]